MQLMLKGDCSNSELARRLNVRESDLRDWRKQYEQFKDSSFPGQDRRSGTDSEVENKAMAYFVRMSS
jgi:transposase-like protein